ncbi:MAG: hypothetical protein DHS20C18_04920 [Saprospiraceae bacterium]|nr:MAG: hypothetical protein DHS20C18_04920 [Saprospiraceae bacterium]
MNKQFLFSLIALFFLSQPLWGQVRYHLLYEQDLGEHFGAENLLAINHAWSKLDERYLPKHLFSEDKEWTNRAYRFAKLLFIDYPFAFVLPSLQHEYFGHGYRARQYGSQVTELKLTLPPPFQLETPNVRYRPILDRTEQEQLVMTVAGTEANAIFSKKIHRNALLSEKLDYHDALLYLYANNDLNSYVTFGRGLGGDVNTYLNNTNTYYQQDELTTKKLFSYGFLSILLDPVNYYAFQSIFNYGWQAQAKTRVPFIRFSQKLSYLPKFRFSLSPFGPELHYENYFKYKAQLFSLAFAHSDGTFQKYWRFSGQIWNVKLANPLYLTARGQFWKQPEFLITDDGQVTDEQGTGAAVITTLYYDWQREPGLLGLMVEVGYKTGGFMEGERLGQGLILRGGLSFNLDGSLK